MNVPRALMALILLGSSGCRQADTHEHAEKADLPSRAITHFTGKSELFAEHPFLVVGHAAPFAAHVTDLRDFSPLTEGTLEAILTDSHGQKEVFKVEGVLRPGIFRPVVTPQRAGTYQLTFRVASPTLTDVVPAGAVTVFPDADSARKAAPVQEENPDEIAFLLEQQWKIPFMTRPVVSASLTDGAVFAATIKPAGGGEAVVAAPTGGRVTFSGKSLQMGDIVQKGQILAYVSPMTEPGDDQASRVQAVRIAEANVRLATLERDRTQRLFAAQALPGKRVEEAKTALAVAQATLAAARQKLQAKETLLSGKGASLERYRVRAPLAGVVVDTPVVAGVSVAAGAPLFRIMHLQTVWAEAKVPEIDLERITGGSSAEVVLPGSTAVHRGTLVTVGHLLDPLSRTVPVVFAVTNPIGKLKIGMSAQVRILTGSSKPGPVIPKSAIIDDNGKPIAYVQTGGESFERRELKLGVKQAGRIQVLSGLSPGDRVVTEGGYEIHLSTLTDAVPAHGHEH